MADLTVEDISQWTIDRLLRNRPDASRVLLRNGMACVGCVMAPFETVAEAAREYGLDPCLLVKELREMDSSYSRRGSRQKLRSRNKRRVDGVGP